MKCTALPALLILSINYYYYTCRNALAKAQKARSLAPGLAFLAAAAAAAGSAPWAAAATAAAVWAGTDAAAGGVCWAVGGPVKGESTSAAQM